MNTYPNPFIPERADPYIVKGNDGFYYFTASYPAFMSAENGYDRIILRRSETVSGLKNAEEYTVWTAHDGGVMSRHIWAPEMHLINNIWYIFFAAGEKENVWNIRPFVLKCSGNNPIEDSWEELGQMQATKEDSLSFTAFSLDMTYFEHKGKHFVIWAQILENSSLLMAEINPENPNRLISLPIVLTKPEYDWERVRFSVNEGASVLKRNRKIYVFFSASGTGSEYCIGLLSADTDADLMKAENWTKRATPVLSTEDLENESGPGHNCFVTDENGRLLLVYHARPMEHFNKKCGSYCEEPLYDPCRHARIKFIEELNFD